MSTTDDLLERIKQLEEENTQERRERERAQRNAEQERHEKEQAQHLLQKTTLEEYLTACQEHVLSKIHLDTDGYLTTRAPTTNPARKHCPTLLMPWDDFIPTQTHMIQLVDRTFPTNERLFESVAGLQTIGDRLDERVVRDEASLVFIENNAIEDPVRVILSKINAFHPERYNLATPDQVEFQTTASSLRESTDPRDTVQRDARLRTDQICVFRNSARQKDIAYVIEYKAPRKLHTQHFEQGLRQMNIFKVVHKQTIPTTEPDKFKHYAERLTAAAVTQTYHYMVEAGLEYGYLTNGDAIVFLKIDWADPTVLRYHLARPSREVLVDEDAAYSNAIIEEEEERNGAAGGPTTPTEKKHRRTPSLDWEPTPVKRTKRHPRQQSPYQPSPPEKSDRVLRSHDRGGPGGGAGSSGGASGGGIPGSGAAGSGHADGGSRGHATTGSSPAATRGGDVGQQRQRRYCTSACLLSLVNGGLMDSNCPNAPLHRKRTLATLHTLDKGQAEKHRHGLSYPQFMLRLQEQLSQSLERGVVIFGKEGACGALFQITLLQFGYTFIAKGVTRGRVPDLEKEVAVYEKLRPLQGHGIPVCLGSVDLEPLGQVFFYDVDVHIIRFLLLSYSGTEVRASGDESRTRIISTTASIIDKMHHLRVIHGDVRRPNVLQGPDGEISLIDFDRAVILPARSRGTTLSAISPNKRRRLVGSDGEEEASSLTTRKSRLSQPAIERAIQQDNSNVQSLFSLDCGRIIV
ncbi:hypothetical protein GMORB2_4300 [Geosmithia morbida]|uniref:Protein kinase domain-containing protein n=1 Tax=Geosmithia morbida TaxID=1094350 RepID=A0A9P4YYX4_9HYPO|nr:uncharacterized protein GMORB2_4300 [Geosmithia morbida]KAF4125460.1 hypothetical protein GMORB2_4300 [Geosmithia morbida]